jgi:hypothetical protein
VGFERPHGGSGGGWTLLRPYPGYRHPIVIEDPENIGPEIKFAAVFRKLEIEIRDSFNPFSQK